MVSAADVDLLRVLPVKNGCRPPSGHLPKSYTGREDEVQALLQAADSKRRVDVLTGTAGTGKTAIALTFAARLKAAAERDRVERQVYWVTARNSLSFLESLTALAHALGADTAAVTRYREMDDCRALWELIRQAPAQAGDLRSVLVIDNVNGPEDCAAVIDEAVRLPPQAWFTVITTQVEDLGALPAGVHQIRVGQMDNTTCSQLIIRIIDDVDTSNDDQAQQVASRTADLLGRLPLALHVAGSQQRSVVVRHTLRGYGEALRRIGCSGPEADGSIRHVALAVRLGMSAISREDRLPVAFVLSLLASMAPAQPFPINILEVVVGAAVTADDAPNEDVEPLLRRGRRTLRDTGLIESGVEDGIQVLWIHPLVAEAVRVLERESQLGAAVPHGFAAAALDRATEDLASGGIVDSTLSLWRLVIPHVQHLLTVGLPGEDPSVGHATSRAAERAIRHLLQRGLHATALAMAECACERVSTVAEENPARLSAILHRGLVRQACRLYGDAFADISEAADVYRRLGLHAEWLQAEFHLATVHHDKGELAEAERLLRSVLEMRTTEFGEDHVDTLAARHRLGMVIQAAGRAAEALTHFDVVFEARQRVLRDPAHPDVIAAMHSQAYARQAIGGPNSLQRAEEDFEAVLRLREKVLGQTHPNTLVTQHNLAWIEQAKGRYIAAENRFRTVLDVQLRRLERDHPHTVATAANLAWDLLQRKQFGKARRLFLQVMQFRSNQLGHNHPDTQTTRGNIAWLTYEEGEWREAAFRLSRLVADRQATLGPRHPRTLTTRHNLALCLRSQRDYSAAASQFRDLMRLQEEVIGEDHPSTLSTKYNFAVTLRLNANEISLGQAITLLEEVLGRQLTIYSSRHPDITRTREELIATLRQRGTALDLDRASDEQTPSRAAAALSRHRTEQEYDDELTVAGTDDPLIGTFAQKSIATFVEPDIIGYQNDLAAAEIH